MAFELTRPSQERCRDGGDAEDFCLPGLELQHELLLSLPDWESVGGVTERLSAAGAQVQALALNRTADTFVLRCRVKAISSARARAFVDELGDIVVGAASVEHLMLAKAGDNARA